MSNNPIKPGKWEAHYSATRYGWEVGPWERTHQARAFVVDTRTTAPGPDEPKTAGETMARAIVRDHNEAGRLREALERIAASECEYGNGADCNSLPRGVYRSVCNPCYARAALGGVDE